MNRMVISMVAVVFLVSAACASKPPKKQFQRSTAEFFKVAVKPFDPVKNLTSYEY